MEVVEANVFKENEISHLFENKDICINLIGILFEKKNNTFKNIHINFPTMISQKCKKYNVKKYTRFATSNAGMKLIQSFTKVILTVTTLTYAATPAIVNKVNELIPNGSPNTTSLIIPDKKIKPYPSDFGCRNTQ